MNHRLLDGGVHLATSEAFFGEENGWFRITFTVEKDVLQTALERYVWCMADVDFRIIGVLKEIEGMEDNIGETLWKPRT